MTDIQKRDETIEAAERIAEAVGATKAFRLNSAQNRVMAALKIRPVINAFKGDHETMKAQYGNPENLCSQFGLPYKAIMEELKNIDELGEDFARELAMAGVSRDVFRDIRRLPEDGQDRVKALLQSPETADSDTIKEVVESLVEEKRELRGEIEARDRELKRAQDAIVKANRAAEHLEDTVEELRGEHRPEDAEFEDFMKSLQARAFSFETTIAVNLKRFEHDPAKVDRIRAAARLAVNSLRRVDLEIGRDYFGEEVYPAEVQELEEAMTRDQEVVSGEDVEE